MPKSKKQGLYSVEVITGARRLDDGISRRGQPQNSKWEYLVKWAGYASDEDSWQPEENFRAGCEALLASFWNHVPIGKDDNIRPGFHIDADEKWIEKEKKRFHQEFTDRNQEKQRSGHQNELQSRREMSEQSKSITTSDGDDSDWDNAPSTSKNSRLVIIIPPRKTNKSIPSVSGESGSRVEPAGEFSRGQTVNAEPSISNSHRYRQIELPESYYRKFQKAT